MELHQTSKQQTLIIKLIYLHYLSLFAGAVVMDDAVYVLWLNPELLGLTGTVAGQAVALLEHVLGAHGVPLLLGFGFLDDAHDPSVFVAVPLVAVASVDAHHFPEQLTLGPALLLGGHFNFLENGRRYGEAHDFGCPAHVHEPMNGLILVKLMITDVLNLSATRHRSPPPPPPPPRPPSHIPPRVSLWRRADFDV